MKGPRLGALSAHVPRTPEEITTAWSGDDRFDGIGLVQGDASDVLDLDRKSGHHPRVELAESGLTVPAGPTVRTPRGEHVYCSPTGLSVCHGFRPGVDVQARGSYVVGPPTHVHPATLDPPGTVRGNGWRDPRPWQPYLWTRPGSPVWSDDVPEVEGTGVPFGLVAGTAPPPLRPEDVWWPTGAELLDAVSRAVLPAEFVTEVATARTRAGRSAGRSAGSGVPVDDWRRSGLPPLEPGDTQRRQLVRAAASCYRRGLTVVETAARLREIADATPLLRPDEPWTDAQLEFIAGDVVRGAPARTARDLNRSRELQTVVTDWTVKTAAS